MNNKRIQRVNDRMNDSMNERVNGSMNARMNESMNERMNGSMNERMNVEPVNERLMNVVSIYERTNECAVHLCVHE